MRLGLFRRDDAERARTAAQADVVKGLVRQQLGLGDETALAVNEIVCADPACPGTETVILVMTPGSRTKAYKVQLPLAEVTREALAAALEG